MKKYNAFDVLGPIMIGPSSSHTAGACKIGNAAIRIAGNDFTHVKFILHGSFAQTYRGHGTDKALLSGIMGFSPNDCRIRHAFELAEERKLNYDFETMNIDDVHPNTVRLVFSFKDKKPMEVTGSSVGGGNIVIVKINDVSLHFKNEYPTLVLQYNEQKGVISFVSTVLSKHGYNIESLNTTKIDEVVTLVLEMEIEVEESVLATILKDERFIFSKYISKED